MACVPSEPCGHSGFRSGAVWRNLAFAGHNCIFEPHLVAITDLALGRLDIAEASVLLVDVLEQGHH
jgi:hypothetical protein